MADLFDLARPRCLAGGGCCIQAVANSAVPERFDLRSTRAALSGKLPAGSEGLGVGCGHDSDLLSPASFSAGSHPARRVAVPSLHPKLS